MDLALRITSINIEGERLLRASRRDLVGRSLLEVFPEAQDGKFELYYRQAIDTAHPVVFEEYSASLEAWFEVRAWSDGHNLNVSFWNIDERRLADAERTAALALAERSNARLRVESAISSRLAGAGSSSEVFELLAQAVIPDLADWCTVVVPRGDVLVRVAAAHRDAPLDTLAKQLIGRYPHAFSGPSPGVVVYRSGVPLRLHRLAQQIIDDLDDTATSAAYGRALRLLGDGPGLVTPIALHGEIVAVLTLVRSRGEPFTDDDVEFVGGVARRVASVLENARTLDSQRAMATALQEAALPKSLPATRGLNLAANYRGASEGDAIGGDWYDAIELPTGHIALVVGDVCGHGLEAAAAMAQIRNELRALLFSSFGPAESLAKLNQLVIAQRSDIFATVVCLEVDPDTGASRWASAGHLAPVLVSRDGTSRYLEGRPSPPVGVANVVDEGIDHELQLRGGDRLLMFTDGLIERRDSGIEIGLTHLMILVEQNRHTTNADTVCKVLLDEMLSASHEDDVCLLVADFIGN